MNETGRETPPIVWLWTSVFGFIENERMLHGFTRGAQAYAEA